LELISEIDPAVKAIMVSGYARNSETTEFQEYGFKAVIAKPFTLEELERTLHEVMLHGSCQELERTVHTIMRPGTYQVH
jgi:CheY-like chemotaxis protein